MLHAAVRAALASDLSSQAPSSADVAGLRYVSDAGPGILRRRAGRGYIYVDGARRPISDPAVLRRIRALVIPPAWRHVWICERPDGHIQASGRDARGRKQYRYHAAWRRVRDAQKFERLVRFATRLPVIRRAVTRDLGRRGLPREKVIATVVRLLETTCLRIGNAEYARANGSFGLTTLRSRHAEISSGGVRFRFRGKAGKALEAGVSDRRIAGIVRACQDLPGQELFQYVADDGSVRSIGSADVNGWLRKASGEDFTAKDFRTWAGTVATAVALAEAGPPPSAAHAKHVVAEAIRETAHRLGNTPAVCRKCYVHPFVIEAYVHGHTIGATGSAAERAVIRLLSGAVESPRTRP